MRLGEKIGQPQKTEERENPDDGLRSTCHQDFFVEQEEGVFCPVIW